MGAALLPPTDTPTNSATTWQNAKACRIASFRSPDFAQFADVFVFVGEELFLFQCKDHQDMKWLSEVHLERWKMGACDDDAVMGFMSAFVKETKKQSAVSSPDDNTNTTTNESKSGDKDATASTASKNAAGKLGEHTLGVQGGGSQHSVATPGTPTETFSIFATLEEARSKIETERAAKELSTQKLHPNAEIKVEATKNTLHGLLTSQKAQQLANGSKDKATADFVRKYFAPWDTLSELATQWYQATNIHLKKIHRCFITPLTIDGTSFASRNLFKEEVVRTDQQSNTKHGFTVRHLARSMGSLDVVPCQVELANGDLFLSTNKLQFLKFDSARMRSNFLDCNPQLTNTSDFSINAKMEQTQ